MKIYKSLFLIIIFSWSTLFFSCYEIEDTGSTRDPNIVNNSTSVIITDVLPQVAGSASEITIFGSGFAGSIEDNWVYFNNVPAVIKSVTNSEIVVYRPKIVSDNIEIKVASSLHIEPGIYANNYPMESIIDTFGVFLALDKITNICIDENDNVYLLFFNASEIRKFNSLGKEDTTFTPVDGSTVLYALDLKEGPDTYIYFLRKSGSRTSIYRFDENSGGSAEFYSRVSGVMNSFDYDQNGNMYLGGRGNASFQGALKVLKADLTEIEYNMYDGYSIKSTRVFNDELYVLAEYIGTDTLNTHISGIFKNQILSADGQLDTTKTVVLDWDLSGDYISSFYNSLSISEDGDIYIATNYDDPVLSISTSGDVSKLYYGLMSPVVNKMMWGGGNYVYLLQNSGSTIADGNQILRINMGKFGAPFYGRDL